MKVLFKHKILLVLLLLIILDVILIGVIANTKQKTTLPTASITALKQKVIEGQTATSSKVVRGSSNPVESQIFITKSGFVPQSLRITKGQQVKFINTDTITHSITSITVTELKNTDALLPNQSFVYTFENAATYIFYIDNDSIHSGEVIVK